MKKILMLFFSILLLSCSSDSNNGSSSSSSSVKWKFKVEGFQYEYNSISDTSGRCEHWSDISGDHTERTSYLVFSGDSVLFYIHFPLEQERVGTIYIGTIPNGRADLTFGPYQQEHVTHEDTKTVLTLNITQVAAAPGGTTKGTFSGTMINLATSKTVEITEGSFEAIRVK